MQRTRSVTGPPYLRILGFVAMTIIPLGCSQSTQPSHLTNLPGVWEWVASVNVQTQERHSPESDAVTALLEFTAQTERAGMFRYFRDGQVAVEDRYDIAFEDAPGNDFIRLNASIDYLTESAWISVGADTLRLNGVRELGFNSVYARVRE